MQQICSRCEKPKANIGSTTEVCVCRNRPKISGKLPIGSKILGSLHLRACGIEIEASHWGHVPAQDNTQYNIGPIGGRFIHDGSVTSGLEWASEPLPVIHPNNNKTLAEQLLQIGDHIDQSRVVFDNTCGFHVHVDARDFSYWELTKVWNNYIVVQNWMYQLCHPQRAALNARRNRYYCNKYEPALAKKLRFLLKQPNLDLKAWLMDQLFTVSTEVIKDSVRRHHRETVVPRYNATTRPLATHGIRPHDLDALKNYKYYNNRYFGFNIMPWFSQGTIEFRMQGYPLTSTDIVLWPLTVCHVVHVLLNGQLLYKEPSNFEDFLRVMQFPEVLQDYVTTKYTEFRQAHLDANMVQIYTELV